MPKCVNLTDKEKFTSDNLRLMKRLFNGEKINFEGKDYKLGNTIVDHYGRAEDNLGRKMFDEIVWRGTYKPAIESYTGFTKGDFRRIKNEIVRESKKLSNPKFNFLEKYGFVRRGVMQKYAITNHLNKQINFITNYESNSFTKYLSSHIALSKLLRTEILARNRSRSSLIPGIKEVRQLEKLENELLLEVNNPTSDAKSGRANEIVKEIKEVLGSKGGEVLKELVEYLEKTPEEIKEGRLIDDPNSLDYGKRVPFSNNIVEAGKVSRLLLNDMGNVLISGLKKHADVIQLGYLGTMEKSALQTTMGRKVQKYLDKIQEEIKAIKDGKENGNYFPHYLSEGFLHLERVMERADKEGYKNADKDISELSSILTEMRGSMGTPKSARFRKSAPYENYLKNPITVLRKYSIDAITFNKAQHLKALYFEGMKGLPKDGKAAEAISDYVADTFKLAENGHKDRPSWVNKMVRTLTGFQFLAKLGFGVGTATRNTLSGLYYVQGVGNLAFARYLRDWNKFENKEIREEVRKAEEEQGFKFEDMASPIFTEGLLPTEGVKAKNVELRENSQGNYVLQYKEGKVWRTFDSILSSASGHGAILQRVTENFLRKHMFRYSFVDKFKELRSNGVGEKESSKLARLHAVDMVARYAFEYAASQKAKLAGGTSSNVGAAGQIAFQFMHYPMSFAQLQAKNFRNMADAAIARQWDNPDLFVPMKFAGLYLFTELMSGIMNLDLHRVMENDTVDRIVDLKDALQGKEVKGRGIIGPTVGDLFFYATLNDFMKLPDNAIVDMLVGYNNAYKLTPDQQKARILSSINVQMSKMITKDYKALDNGNGWDVLMHEFGVYPTKHTRELRQKEPFKTLFPGTSGKEKETEASKLRKKKLAKDEELTKLYRAMGI